MVYWDGHQPVTPVEKGAPSSIAALLQRTVLRVMAEQQSESADTDCTIRHQPTASAVHP